MTDAKIATPARYVPIYGISFGGESSPAIPVDGANPLPVVASQPQVAAESAPLASIRNSSGATDAFVPVLGRPI